MNSLLTLLGALAAVFGTTPDRPPYQPGQVWEYATRPQDSGSRIKIQQIEQAPDGTIYHISMIGARIGPDGKPAQVAHLPVSRRTLDASVTRLGPQDTAFPDAAEGIATWRENKGGVFTISLAEIADTLESSLRQAQ